MNCKYIRNKPLLCCYGKGSQKIDGVMISEQPKSMFKRGKKGKGIALF